MKRLVKLDLDHFNWGCTDIRKSRAVFDNLGFNTNEDILVTEKEELYFTHYYFDYGSAYIGHFPIKKDGTTWAVLDGIPVFDQKGEDGLYSFVLSTTNRFKTRKALLQAGYNATYAMAPVPRGGNDCYHKDCGGPTHSSIFFIRMNQLPFKMNQMFACLEHLDEYEVHYDRKNVRAYHDNCVNGVESVTVYYENTEDLEIAHREFNKIYQAVSPFSEKESATNYFWLVDKAGYEAEFGVEAPKQNSPVVAIEFMNGDKEYIAACADKQGLSHFLKDGKLYVDAREDTKSFLVFG